MKKSIILCVVLLLCACGVRQQSKIRTDKAEVAEVKKNFMLLSPVQLASDDSLLWISDDGAEKMVWIMDMRTGDSITSFLAKGRGPGESLPNIEIIFNDDKVCFYSWSPLASFFEADKQTILKSGVRSLKQTFRFSPETNRVLPLSDTTFLTSGSFEKGRFRWVNVSYPDSVIYTGLFPDYWSDESSIPIAAKNRFHHTKLYRNTHNNLIAAVSPYVLSFYQPDEQGVVSVKDTLLAEYQYDYQNTGMLRMSKKRANVINGCRNATANNHHIYLLFDTRTEAKTDEDTYYPLIQVYDWQGKHIRNIDPGCRLSTLTADSADRYLYGLTDLGNDNGPKIVRVTL